MDERGGMLFNHRRQSRDRAVTEDIVASLGNKTLYMAPMSESLFRDTDAHCVSEEDFLQHAGKGEVCFVEDRHLTEFVDRIEQVTVYDWNRHYPADFTFDLSLAELGFRLVQTDEFAGFSHETITKEIYQK